MDIDFAFVTCTQFKDLISDDKLLFHALETKGYRCQALVWNDPAVNWRTVRIALSGPPGITTLSMTSS
jgi:hypothetical protein